MSTKQEFNCIFCKDVFENKEDLQEHFRKHGDPKFKNRFEIDTQASNEKSKEKAEMVSCDVCSQLFPTISKAITHKHKVHPDHDAKYFCPWCGKLFTMKHLYNVHVQSAHGNEDKPEDKNFPCDSCSVDFYIPSAMINHNKFFHRQDTDLPDVGQSKKIKFYNQEMIPVYYCAFCGEEYENKVNLIKHMSDDHGDENQSPEEVLKCPLCDAVFFHLDAYEIHLTFHTSEDMYSVENPEFKDLQDYSLETVPPLIEKVENLEDQNQDTDAESTMNAVGIEKFLELAMDQSNDSNPVKVKKHKKHKKSKKSAITLDEFLSMNTDVFGEGLDFQGIEEVPTRIVKKQLKNNKKTNSAVTTAELEKLKAAGIVIKRSVGRNPIVKTLKVDNVIPNRKTQNKPVNKIRQVREIETSSEVLTKLINQSNNQIRIVKKNNPTNASAEENESSQDNMDKNLTVDPNIDDEHSGSPKADDISEKSPEAATTDNPLLSKVSDAKFDSDDTQPTKPNSSSINMREILDTNNLPKPEENQNEVINNQDEEQEHEVTDKNESDQFESDAEMDMEMETNKYELDKCDKNDNSMDKIKMASTSNKNNTLNKTSDSLSTLKHLSHLITVKPVSQSKTNTVVEPVNDTITETSKHTAQKDTSNLLPATDITSSNKPKIIVEKDPTMDALKNLSKNITIKSLSTKRSIDESDAEESDAAEENENAMENINLQDNNTNLTIKKIKVEQSEPNISGKINALNNQEKKCNPTKQVTKSAMGKCSSKTIVENSDNSLPTSNVNILKRLTNITTKPIFNKNNCRPVLVKPANTLKKIVETEQKQEEIIEIFDVDDSDDEHENYTKQPETNQNAKSMDALKHLSKNITVKSLNQQSKQKNIKVEHNVKIEKEDYDSQSNLDESNADIENKNMAYKSILQGLCKNITIKSRNTSPSQVNKCQEFNPKTLEHYEGSDSDSDVGKVKITELDNDMIENKMTEKLNAKEYPIIESPEESCSDNEDVNEDIHDFETDIKASTVQKISQNTDTNVNSVCFNNLRNINKNITIKSLSKGCTENDDNTKLAHTHEGAEMSQNQKKQLPAKQLVKANHTDNTNTTTSNQYSNRNVSAVNQVNTVNKEVTVKTFQTRTVIQEITTTVTKTIKTVNQTVKQEVRNAFQTNNPVVMQRVQGIRPNQSKNLQGVVIRHASPALGPRASINSPTQIRPAGNVVRPAKQIAPMKPAIVRPNNPRTPIGKKVTPAPSPNNPVIGRPLKIAPSAKTATIVKRPNTEDLSGPFSCFKKPKESLIPVSDIPTFASSSNDAIAQFTSASHTSTSNFASTTKIMKGNSVVTSKQMKSEVNTASQQMSRVSNTSGIKVMTSQQKQTQVQEKCETSAMKRTTLEAIQRLQKQGLLVKKPRVDANEGSEDSDHEAHNNVDYSSPDEHEEK